MRKLIVVASTAVALIVSAAAHAEGWACTIDRATGFALEKGSKKWVVATFDTTKFKYKITKTDSLGLAKDRFIAAFPHEWAVSEPVGNPIAYCGKNKDGHFVCSAPAFHYEFFGPLYAVGFDPESLRFRVAYLSGYVESDDTPMIQIGTCFPI